jgi:hypothetical protein
MFPAILSKKIETLFLCLPGVPIPKFVSSCGPPFANFTFEERPAVQFAKSAWHDECDENLEKA